ncbi:MAG: hydantoinase/oxoprolinase family protein, partial [Pseudomonadota bacterium]
EVAGERIALESLDILTLGAGGGSIAFLGPGGLLQVGPRSAGAVPGPACYGQGGTEATVTDANLVLGYLDAGNFLGGQRVLDRAAAEAAFARLGARLGLHAMQAAAGAHRLANLRMADGIRLATVRRGVDPRGFTLLAFGGAAGLHASAVARELGMNKVAVPVFAAGLSAWGMLHTDLRYEVSRSLEGAGLPPDAELRAIFASLEAEGRARVAHWFGGEVSVRRAADMRYGEQVFEVGVPLDAVDFAAEGVSARVAEAFHARHERIFTYALRGDEVALVNARIAVLGLLEGGPARATMPKGAPFAPRRRVTLETGPAEIPVHAFASLPPREAFTGPAIIESDTTTVLLLAGDVARMDARGWLEIALS